MSKVVVTRSRQLALSARQQRTARATPGKSVRCVPLRSAQATLEVDLPTPKLSRFFLNSTRKKVSAAAFTAVKLKAVGCHRWDRSTAVSQHGSIGSLRKLPCIDVSLFSVSSSSAPRMQQLCRRILRNSKLLDLVHSAQLSTGSATSPVASTSNSVDLLGLQIFRQLAPRKVSYQPCALRQARYLRSAKAISTSRWACKVKVF